MNKKYLKYKLCYVERVDNENVFKLYFTDNFENQWGDDWNDTPADCNAEPPYEDEEHHIFSLYLELMWLSDIVFNGSHLSVENLNKRVSPWIIYEGNLFIYGGITLEELINLLKNNEDKHRLFLEFNMEV